MTTLKLDNLDRQILKLVAEDARIPFLEVARICNVSGAAIHQRVQKLTGMGIIKGSQYIIDPEKIGYETCAYIGLNLKQPETFDAVVEELKKIPEVVECHYTTGNYDLFTKIYARNNHHLLNIIHDKLQRIGPIVLRERRQLFHGRARNGSAEIQLCNIAKQRADVFRVK